MAAILDGQYVTNFNSFMKRQNFHFHVLLFLVTVADGHLGLPSGINLNEFCRSF